MPGVDIGYTLFLVRLAAPSKSQKLVFEVTHRGE